MTREQARRLLDFVYVPHSYGRPGAPARVVHLCRGCGEGGLVTHPPECPIADALPALEEIANAKMPSRAELMAFVDEVHDWMHAELGHVTKPEFLRRMPRSTP